MKSNQDLIQIEAYLQGSLCNEELEKIKKRIANDPAFAKRVSEIRFIKESAILSKKKTLLSELKKLEDSHDGSKPK